VAESLLPERWRIWCSLSMSERIVSNPFFLSHW
jgi:hypothetical protein